MQYYTKQQLQGAGRYSGHCRIGNWNEDLEMEETQLKDYLTKKDRGELKLDHFQQRMLKALEKVELKSTSSEGMVKFGDAIQIKSVTNGAVVAVDVEDRDNRHGEDACAVTATPHNSQAADPCARNTFFIVKYDPASPKANDFWFEGDTVRYGQKVMLVANSMTYGEAQSSTGGSAPLALRSWPISTVHFAKFSRHQEVGMTSKVTYDCVWEVLAPDPTKRAISLGAEVMAGAPVCLMHSATKQNLNLEGQVILNDFGAELEISGKTVSPNGKISTLESMALGKFRGDLEKAELSSNYFVLWPGEC